VGGISVAIADESDATKILRREHRVERKQPVAPGILEIRIDGQRFDFSASDQAVSGIVTDLEILDLMRLRSPLLHRGIAIIEAQIVVIRRDRTENVVPDNFGRDRRVVGVKQRERLSGDIT